jgi:hypothetical protein
MGSNYEPLMQAAREYCRLIESAGAEDTEWLAKVARLLPRLHALVAALEPGDGGVEPGVLGDLDSRFELFSHLRKSLGELDSYWLEFDSPRANIPATGSLADDLTDIYCDLKRGLERIEAMGDARAALNDWQAGFAIHWGQHLVDAERHLYALSSRNLLA